MRRFPMRRFPIRLSTTTTGRAIPARKSCSAADRILAGLDIGQFLDLSVNAPALTLRA